MQEGRVQVDSDWNEQADVNLHFARFLATSIIGPHGGSRNGFKIGGELSGKGLRYDFTINEGYYFVDGILCKNEKTRTFSSQPGHASQPPLPGVPGLNLAYLDVWERELSGQADPSANEVALFGPDTSTRRRISWRVGALPLRRVRKNWSVSYVENALKKGVGTTEMPTLVPEGRYRGLENQLYRVEIHDPGAPGTASFKWSRDNGSVVSPILPVPTARNYHGYIGLEDGIQVSFGEGVYQLGDYWLIPARATGTVLWPAKGGKLVPMPPFGARNHYCPLAIVTFGSRGQVTAIDDMRREVDAFDLWYKVEDVLVQHGQVRTFPKWTGIDSSDLGLALLELLAYVGDQLSYYQDEIANEAYLSTARRRISTHRRGVGGARRHGPHTRTSSSNLKRIRVQKA